MNCCCEVASDRTVLFVLVLVLVLSVLYHLRTSAVQIVFGHFESNRTVELLFEILNRIEWLSSVSKVTSSKYLLNKFNCF